MEEMYVAFLVESAFRRSRMLFEMLELPATMAEVSKLEAQARGDYAATEFGEELYLKWPSRLEDFLDPIQPLESPVAPRTVEELADILKRLWRCATVPALENAGTTRSRQRNANVRRFNRHGFRGHPGVGSGQVFRSQRLTRLFLPKSRSFFAFLTNKVERPLNLLLHTLPSRAL
jgi:hypothetical protein